MTLEEYLRHFGTGQDLPAAMAITLVAGVVASAVCPCTLPIGLGMATASGASEAEGRSRGLGVAIAFFVGIVVNLTLLGAAAGRLGAFATESFGRWWTLIMALLSFVFAIVAFSAQRLQIQKLTALRRPGIGGAFGYGFVFSLGTSVAPLLLLLAVSAAGGGVWRGVGLALAFGVGRGLPFLIAGVVASAVTRFARLEALRRWLQLASGCALLFVSGYYAHAFLAFL